MRNLTLKEQDLIKEARLQGGGGMMVDGGTVEALLQELNELRALKLKIKTALEPEPEPTLPAGWFHHKSPITLKWPSGDEREFEGGIVRKNDKHMIVATIEQGSGSYWLVHRLDERGELTIETGEEVGQPKGCDIEDYTIPIASAEAALLPTAPADDWPF